MCYFLAFPELLKTPLSLFLANKNLKVANLPLIPEAHLPKQLFEMDPKKIVGLTNDPNVFKRDS